MTSLLNARICIGVTMTLTTPMTKSEYEITSTQLLISTRKPRTTDLHEHHNPKLPLHQGHPISAEALQGRDQVDASQCSLAQPRNVLRMSGRVLFSESLHRPEPTVSPSEEAAGAVLRKGLAHLAWLDGDVCVGKESRGDKDV